MAMSEGPCLEALLASEFHTASFLWEGDVFEERGDQDTDHTGLSGLPCGGRGQGSAQYCGQTSGLGSALSLQIKLKIPPP